MGHLWTTGDLTGLHNWCLKEKGFMVMGRWWHSHDTGLTGPRRIPCQTTHSCMWMYRHTNNKYFLFFKFLNSSISFCSPWGVVHHQRWINASCRRQVGQTPWNHGSHDGVHMSRQRPWGVELRCVFTAARSESRNKTSEVVLEQLESENSASTFCVADFSLSLCVQISALLTACTTR